MSVFHFFPVIFFMATMKHLLFGTEPQRWFNFYSQLLLTKNAIDLQQQIKYIHTICVNVACFKCERYPKVNLPLASPAFSQTAAATLE